jgi:hypothetical protein
MPTENDRSCFAFPDSTPTWISRASAGCVATVALATTSFAQCEAAKWSAPSTLASGAVEVALDLDDTTIAVGRPGHDGHGHADIGALAVRRRDAYRIWNVEFEIEPPAAFSFVERLGRAVAIDGDELVATFGVRGDAFTAGFVHFRRSGTTWNVVDLWTSQLAASGHGDAGLELLREWLVVGAPQASINGVAASGMVEVRRLVNGRFEPHAVLTASAATSGARFGASLALDGERLVVGAPGAGTLHLFECDSSGAWLEVASHSAAPADHTEYGRAVAIDGTDVFATGTPAPNVPARVVHLVRAPAGAPLPWSSIGEVEAPAGAAAPRVLAADADLLVLGRPPGAAATLGDVHLFEDEGTGATWSDRGSLKLPSPPSAAWHGELALDGDLLAAVVDTAATEEVRIVEVHGVGDLLRACPSVISWTTKGDQFLPIEAGPGRAFHPYWVFGSVTGTAVGFGIGPWHVPLDFDWYTEMGIYTPNSSILYQNVGLLDQNGRATAIYTLPSAVGPWVIGVVAYHVAIVIDPNTLGIVALSNVTTLEITP